MITIDVIDEGWPEDRDWQMVADAAVAEAIIASGSAIPAIAEVAIRLTSDEVVRNLNRDYRGKDQPTNVLSFPMLDASEREALGDSDIPILLGDIVLARTVCEIEASERAVPLAHHATHLIVHGMLHLLGYDHIDDDDAQAMEAIETSAMAALGLHAPYGD